MPHIRQAALAVILTVLFADIAVSFDMVPSASHVKRSEKPERGLVVRDRLTVACPENEGWKEHVGVFASHLERLTHREHRVDFQNADGALLVFRVDESLPLEAYEIDIDATQAVVVASSLKGLSNATSTLLQMSGSTPDGSLPAARIEDAPKASYRSFMVDMGRNPHSLELLKETVDFLWYYKIDSLHLHLTDDQRFAFPSRAFPDLWDKRISSDQFRELERYACLRGVSIIPELEVPGHSALLRAKYPEVFGESATQLARSDTALQGIKTLLDEMLDVFPSTPYVHVGGDEAFGVPEDLQRTLINKLHAYLESKGRQTVVWEGPRPGEGDNRVHPDVIHLNWRTINYRPDAMLADGHRVVNAAWDPLYIVDHYPRTNFTMTSPQRIYETQELTRFKHVNPAIGTYADPVEVSPTDRLIGFCMPWWEGREENYFSQTFPRMIPFAEVAWAAPPQRDYASFSRRSEQAEQTRRQVFYPIEIRAEGLAVEADGVFHVGAESEGAIVTLESRWRRSPTDAAQIRYTLDGSAPQIDSTLYTGPIRLHRTQTIRAALFVGGEQVGHGGRRNFVAVTPQTNLALGKPVTSTAPSGSPFSVERVTDGGVDNLGFYLGYPTEPHPVEVTVDLEQTHRVGRIVVHAYTVSNSYEKYTVEVSDDGVVYEEVGARLSKPDQATASVEHRFEPRTVRFIRVRSEGNKGYVFDSFSKLVEIQAFE